MVVYPEALIIGTCRFEHEAALTDFLASLDIVRLTQITQRDATGEQIVACADRLGHAVAFIVLWDPQDTNTNFIERLLHVDTLPGRPYIVITPHESWFDVCEELETLPSHDPEDTRVQVIHFNEMHTTEIRDVMRLHFTRTCGIYLNPRSKQVIPARSTHDPTRNERFHRIEPRVMQRGLFRIRSSPISRWLEDQATTKKRR